MKKKPVRKLIYICIALFFITIVFWLLYNSPSNSDLSGLEPPNYFNIVDYSCKDGVFRAIIRNSVSYPFNFGNSCILNSSTVAICGDMTAVKTTGTFSEAPTIFPTSIAPDKTATFSDVCGVNNTCVYRIAISAISKTHIAAVTVNC